MIAQRRDVVYGSVHDLHDRLALCKVRERTALQIVAGIHEQNVISLLLVILFELRHSADSQASVRSLHITMHIVGVQDHKLCAFGGLGARIAGGSLLVRIAGDCLLVRARLRFRAGLSLRAGLRFLAGLAGLSCLSGALPGCAGSCPAAAACDGTDS